MQEEGGFLCIDLKSFYASVECVERGLDPLRTHLVVADASRTEKTICLAVSPPLKQYGISGRARLFEVVQQVRDVNAVRLRAAPNRTFTGTSADADALAASPELKLDYIVAPPQMAKYMAYSRRIYQIYLRYIAPEDIHVYSIDEVMMDVSRYLATYGLTARELAQRMIHAVLAETGITATAGIGTNLYLSKVAMDIMAKRAQPDAQGVRIAALDEESYRRELWTHRPLTDFWRIGHGYAKKLEACGLRTMGDVARCSVGKPEDYYNEELLYRLFGVNAELLIDHAWGWEPCSMAAVKAYRPETNSLSTGQVLHCPYDYDKTRLIVWEMTEALSLDLLAKGLVTDQLVLTLGYDIENLSDPARRSRYHGEVVTDPYGRQAPKHAHGTANLTRPTASARLLLDTVMALFTRIADKDLLVRRVTICTNHLVDAEEAARQPAAQQLSFLDEPAPGEEPDAALQREERIQRAMLSIRSRFGKNAILRGTNFVDGATMRDRNQQIGGHKA